MKQLTRSERKKRKKKRSTQSGARSGTRDHHGIGRTMYAHAQSGDVPGNPHAAATAAASNRRSDSTRKTAGDTAATATRCWEGRPQWSLLARDQESDRRPHKAPRSQQCPHKAAPGALGDRLRRPAAVQGGGVVPLCCGPPLTSVYFHM